MKINLSKQSLQKAIKELEVFGKKLESSINLDIEKATDELYNKVIENCKNNNITLHYNNIHKEYDRSLNIGKVWTDDIVIQFNEFGTGIEGVQDKWANYFEYVVDESGRGELGWGFYNKEHRYGGITHGIETRHMFYDALVEMQEELPNNISITVGRLIGDMY